MSNVAAEKVFLAGVARYPQRLFEFVEYLDEEDFKHSVTAMTFEAMKSLVIEKEAEKLTKAKLVAEAKALGHHNYLAATKNGEWLDELFAEEVGEHELDAHFMEVKRQSLKDQYAESFVELRDYLSTTNDPLSIMIGKVENTIVSKVNVLDKGEHAIEDLREGFEEFINSIADDPGHMGLDLGYPLWQERIGQIRNGAITFMVGTTGCLAGDTLIYDSRTGKCKKIKDIVNGESCLPASMSSRKCLNRRKILNRFNNGRRKVWRIKTNLGYSIDCTSNHPFFKDNNWVPARGLTIGDFIATPRKLPEPYTPLNDFCLDESYLLGALFGDGACSSNGIVFTSTDQNVIGKVQQSCDQLGYKCNKIKSHKYDYYISYECKQLLKRAGLIDCIARNKSITDAIHSLDNNRLSLFLAGLWDTDGSVLYGKNNDIEISITLASEDAIAGIQKLLLRFGIVSAARYKKSTCNGKTFDAWRLTVVTRESQKNFISSFTVNKMQCSDKVANAKLILDYFSRTIENSNIDVLDPQHVHGIIKEFCIKDSDFSIPDIYSSRRITRSRTRDIGDLLECDELVDLANSDVFMDKIISIEYIGIQQVYDIEVSNDHNFVANNIIVHNSGKSQFGMKAAVIAARKGIPVLYLDSELNKQDQWIRIAAMIAKVPSEYIETGFWRMKDKELLDNGVDDPHKRDEIMMHGRKLREPRLWEAVKAMPIFYQSISGLSVPDVLPHVRRWLLTHVKPDRETRVPQCLVVYDYIKLSMTNEISRGVLQEWQQHGLHIAALHDFANKYNIPMIGFGQTNNELDEGIRCVAGGKRISENVDSVSYFKRKSDQERANDGSGTHLMKVFKARYGKGLWNSWVNYSADLSCGDFQELDIGNVAPPQQDDDDDNDE